MKHQKQITQSYARSLIYTILSVPLLFLHYLVAAQNPTATVVYDFPYDMKHYSTELATDYVIPTQGIVTAGTVFNYNSSGKNLPHFMQIGSNGHQNFSVIYDNNNYDEIRAVDIVGDGAASSAIYYIVCLARPTQGNGTDRILVIPVDLTGATVGTPWEISCLNDDEGLYPVHSIYHSNGELYICGYWTDNNTALPGEPTYFGYDNKRGFVINCTNTGIINNSVTINTVYTNWGAYAEDYDIAMRLVELQNGDIFVTGSVNNVQYDAFKATEAYHSGTMNVVFDPGLSLVNEDHFSNNASVIYTGDEHGIGLVEDPANGNNYLIGNFYYHHPPHSNTTLDPAPGLFWVTRLDGSFNHTNSNTDRFYFASYDYAWALQTLPSGSTPPVNGTQFVIAGMENQEWCSGTAPSWNDVRPFLFDIGVDYTGGVITPTFTNWTTYHTTTGTGDTLSASNSYPRLGGGMSNILWNTTYAARATGNDDIVMMVPKWNLGNGSVPDRLNIKRIMARASDLAEPNCPNSYQTELGDDGCDVHTFYNTEIVDLGYSLNQVVSTPYVSLSLNSSGVNVNAANYIPTAEPDCFYTPGTYKHAPASVAGVYQRNPDTKVFPNPAHKKLRISLSETINDEAGVEVLLSNIYGQLVQRLYTGKAKNITEDQELSLPDVNTGIYFITVVADNKEVHHQKLVIE